MQIFLIIILSLVFGGAIGFSIGFFIFSIMLNRSNNFGDTRLNDYAKASEIEVTYKADRIQRDPAVLKQHLEYGMHDLINQPSYRAIMERSVKNPDSDPVSHNV
jgi:hypothetical protein